MSAQANAAPKPSAGRAGVLLIHGVGHARPGEVLAAATDALAARPDAPLTFEPHSEVRAVAERRHAARDGAPSAYPRHLRRARDAETGDETVFAELLWSDVKSADARYMTPPLLFLSSILRAHRVIGALLARRADPFAACLRPLLLAGAYLLRGPIVGLNLVLITLLLAIKYCAIASQTFGFPMEALYFVCGGFAFSALIGLTLLSGRLFASRLFAEIGWAMLAISALGLAAVPLAHEGGPLGAFNEFAFFSKAWALLILLWGMLAAIVLLAAALLTLALLLAFRPAGLAANRASVLALAILMFQSLIWATVMRTVWLSLGPDLAAVIDLAALPIVASAETLKTLQITVLANLVILAAVFAALVLVALLRFALSRALPRSRAHRLPRLMFSPLALNLGLVLGVAAYLASITLVLGRTALGDAVAPYLPAMLTETFDQALPMIRQRPLEFLASSLVVLSPALLFLFGRTLTNASHLLQDIIDYHPDCSAGAGAERLAPRDRIADRFAQSVEHLIEQERVDRLLIVAHSQGTVIAFDALRAAAHPPDPTRAEPTAPDWLDRNVRLITMGSPLRSIYAHYFHDHAPLSRALADLRPRLGAWTNFFRVDDAIGTRLTVRPGDLVAERALGPGGHADYWSEPEVGDAILDAVRPDRGSKR